MHMKEASFSGISANPRLERTAAYLKIEESALLLLKKDWVYQHPRTRRKKAKNLTYRAMTSVKLVGGFTGPG